MSHRTDHHPWAIHWLDARGHVAPYVAAVEAAVAEVRERAASMVALPPLDLVVAAATGRVIPEIGHVGHSLYPGGIFLTLDPQNPSLTDNLGEPLARMIAHELHHALRWETIGYGMTLGEALVSEGLAGHFVAQLFASPPELWERALDGAALAAAATRAQDALEDPRYDHAAWFFGAGSQPRWTGYTLGYAVVGAWLAAEPGRTAAGAISVPAAEITPGLAVLSAAVPPS